MTTPPTSESEQFRSSVPSMFIWMFVLSLPVIFCLALVLQAANNDFNGLHIHPYWLVLVSVPHSIFLLIGARRLSKFCPTTISADGVTTQSFTGGQRFVRWQDITTARTLRVLNLKWIFIYPAGESNAIQVPLFQPRKVEFIQEIQRLAPPGNPILNHLP